MDAVVQRQLDLVGSAMLEFEGGPEHVVGVRRNPAAAEQIATRMRLNNPINNPTVVFRRRLALDAGGYADLRYMQDYDLFARMLAAGGRAENLDEPLVLFNAGDGMISRGAAAGGCCPTSGKCSAGSVATGTIGNVLLARNMVVRGAFLRHPAHPAQAGLRRGSLRRGHDDPAAPATAAVTDRGRPVSTPALTFVVVSYGGVDDATRLVSSLGTDTALEVVLCANKPGDTAAATAAFSDDPRVRVLSFEDNPGYLPALQRALPHVDTSSPVVLCNCDLVADPGLVSELLRQVDAFPDAGWLAPAVIGSLGVDQNPNLLTPPSARRIARPRGGAPGAAGGRPAPAAQGRPQLAHRQRGRAGQRGVRRTRLLHRAHARFFAAGGSCDYPFALFGGAVVRAGVRSARPRGAVRAQRSAPPHRARRHGSHPPRCRRPGQVRRAALLGPRREGSRLVTAPRVPSRYPGRVTVGWPQ